MDITRSIRNDYVFFTLTGLNALCSVYNDLPTHGTLFSRIFTVAFFTIQSPILLYSMACSSTLKDRRIRFGYFLFSLALKDFLDLRCSGSKAFWKTNTFVQLFIFGGHEVSHWYAVSSYKQSLPQGKVDEALIVQGESLLSGPLSDEDRKELELLIYQNIFRKLEGDALVPAARKLADVFMFIPFEAFFTLYQRGGKKEDLLRALNLVNTPLLMDSKLENFVRCHLAIPDLRDDRGCELAILRTIIWKPTRPTYLFALGFYYQNDTDWAQSAMEQDGCGLTDCISKIEEKKNLGFYEILGLSVAVLISAKEKLNADMRGNNAGFFDQDVSIGERVQPNQKSKKNVDLKSEENNELSRLMDETLKISISEDPEFESKSLEDIVSKEELRDKAVKQLEKVLEEVSEGDIVNRVKEIQKEKIQIGRNIKRSVQK